MVTATSRNGEFPDPDSGPQPHVLFGHEVPGHIVEKAGPFALGMLTTYLLQILMPIFLYYTSVTARFLSVAFMWLSLSGVICWYAGLINPQAADWQRSVARIKARFSPKETEPEVSANSTKHDRPQEHIEQPTSRSTSHDNQDDQGYPSYIRYNARAIAERDQLDPSPIMSSISSRNSFPRSHTDPLEPSPVIISRNANPRSHIERSHTEIEELQPAAIIHPRPAAIIQPRPVYQRSKTEKDELKPAPTINVRPFITPIREVPRQSQSDLSVPQKSTQTTKPASKERPAAERKGSEGSLLRQLMHPRSTRRPTSLNVVESATDSSVTRRNSSGSSGSSGSDKSASKKSKPLPPVTDKEVPDADQAKPRSMDPFIEKPHLGTLGRSNSITSKASVLGTRANYSKFLANVNK